MKLRTPEARDAIVKAFLDGDTLWDIANRYEATNVAVCVYLKTLGIDTSRRAQAFNRLRKTEARKDWLEGDSVKLIAERYGFGDITVAAYIKKSLQLQPNKRATRHRKHSFTDAQVAQIKADYVAGMSLRKLGYKWGVRSEPLMVHYLQTWKVKIRTKGEAVSLAWEQGRMARKDGSKNGLGAAVDLPKAAIKTAYEAGDSVLQLSERYGVCAATIRKHLSKYGVRIRTHREAMANAYKTGRNKGRASRQPVAA